MKPRMRATDVVSVAAASLSSRRVRAVLSIIGVSIGIAAVVAVLGITRSSQADLLGKVDRLGTNLLTVTSGRTLGGGDASLPAGSAAAVSRTQWVQGAAPTADLSGIGAFRTDLIPPYLGGGLAVRACDPALLSALDGRLAAGRFLDEATTHYPVTVLGHAAATHLGITELSGNPRVFLGGQWFAVAGVLEPFELAPEIDNSALVGFPVATSKFGFNGHPSRIYVRADTGHTAEVAAMLGRAANPAHPEEVSVSRPSDALAARLAIADSGTALFLGLGAVALFVGGVGIANVMVISVLERRNEIGLRRALGATRRHVAVQFMAEALLLTLGGGATGILIGAAISYAVATQRGWQVLIPASAVWMGMAAAVVIGVLAGLYPAFRAARLSPTDALRAM